ncbi:hypothetical protein [Mycobacterium genavense]|uniref:hypothetical protein n=1 Tax=Mycobacterium genavense TaxID=36812 RepID=UPI000470FCD1|nr:hypothetical protein [Mycobacterium genavense]
MRAVISLASRSLAAMSVMVSMSCTAAPQHAAAQPPGFPDLGGFAPVPVDAYLAEPGRGPRFAYFSTPYNIQCLFEAGEPIPAWSGQGISCHGDMPDGDPCVVGTAAVGSGPAYAITRTADKCGAPFTRGALLNAGQKVSFRNATCAVGADRLVACLDTTSGQHGFVLKPSGSDAF